MSDHNKVTVVILLSQIGCFVVGWIMGASTK
jgi:hypothetical protein